MEPGADLILANRAYIDHPKPPGGAEPPASGQGGLLAAVRPAIVPWDGNSGTTWIGAGRGTADRDWVDADGYEILSTARGPLRHRRLFFDEATWRGHYAETANSFLWPLMHLVREPLPERTGYYPKPEAPSAEAWKAFERVNDAFARAANEVTGARMCWIHDYQLALAPALLRSLEFDGAIGFFLHIPVPSPEVALPLLDEQGVDVLRHTIQGMLGADLVGVQTARDRGHLQAIAEGMALGTVSSSGLTLADGRDVAIGVYPVGVDVDEVLAAARSGQVPAIVQDVRRQGLPLVVGLERADFTKGIPERLAAIAAAFRTGEAFVYAGISSPTREGIGAYGRLGPAIAAGEADCRAALTEGSSGAFLQVRQTISWGEVVALQRDADVVFTPSLADGMNLVPLQAAMAQSVRPEHERAVIITGRDAGVAAAYAAFEEDGLVAVDPLDPAAMLHTLRAALDGRPGRVSDRLVEAVRRNDARHWATEFLTDLEAQC